VGLEGQKKLKAAAVLVIGTGGLGSPVALYLAAAGVGRIGLVDYDVVDYSNLQRQVIHSMSTLDELKVVSARQRLLEMNPGIRVDIYNEIFTAKNALRIAEPYDIIVDCSDNFPTRYLSNDLAVLTGKPNVYGSIFRFDGQVSVFGGALDEAKKNRIGYLPEERGLYKDMKLEPTLIYLATLKGVDKRTARTHLTEWLQRLDLYDHRQKKIQELSRGMQQKAQFIATLLHDPDLIIVDEPFSGLDPVNTRLIKQIILEQRDAGKTIIMSTHQMHQVEALCSRIVLIDEGYSVLYGEVDAIKRDFAGHAVIVRGQGDFSALPGVQEIRPENGGWHLTLEEGASPQGIFQALAAREDIVIERFEIAEPSLDDIFVAVVQNRQKLGGRDA
jgi:ABC-2 type transport system ATP-binding protein